MTRGSTLIDVHTHVVPRHFPANPSPATNARWPCMCDGAAGRATIRFGDKPFRELDARSWDVAARIAAMDCEGIAIQALSPMPELLSYWFAPADGLALARHVNAAIAEMVARGAGRFVGFGSVPLQDPALAARELTRLRADGFAGVEIGSNINGAVLGEARFDEFYAEAERLDLALFVHALHPIGADRLEAFPDLVPFAAFPLDTGLSAISLIRAGVTERFPRLRFGFSHGGGAVVPLVHRLHQGWQLSQGFDGRLPQPPLACARRFFYDSLVYDPTYLQHLADVFAPGQVFAGTDFPYAIAQTELPSFLAASSSATLPSLFADAARRFLGLPG